MKYPQRGEVWLIDLGMAAKVRPCLIVSATFGDDDRAIVTIVPRTTSARGTQYEAPVPVTFLKPGAFDAQGVTTVPTRHAVRLLGTLTATQMRQVEAVLCKWLGLPCASAE